MKLAELLDVNLLRVHIENKVVNERVHSEFPDLKIYNYGVRAQFENIWDDVTCLTRGLIVRGDEVIARPFRKFFNFNTDFRLETLEANLPKNPVSIEITDKLDGSLGILYTRPDGKPAIATRGSFESDQAKWATDWYSKHASGFKWPEGYTPLFEIIYPENRIVCKYDYEGLVLLALVHNEMGCERRHHVIARLAKEAGIPAVKLFEKSLTECVQENHEGLEGYVISYHEDIYGPPLKIKVKFADYVRLHRLITGISPKEIWSMLQAGQDPLEEFKDVPVHFKEWLERWNKTITEDRAQWEMNARILMRQYQGERGDHPALRKEFAAYATKQRDFAPVLFAMWDDNQEKIDSILWKLVKPKGGDVFRKDE